MIVIEAIGYHESWQACHVRRMTLGAGIGMLGIGTPSLDRFVDPVETLTWLILVCAVRQVALGMAAQTE